MENILSKDKEVVTTSFCDDVLGTLDATALSKLIKNGSVSVDEVQKASLDRANRVNSRLNAIADSWIDRKEIVVSNAADGIFSGVPSYIKDTDDFVGLKTSNGTRAYQSIPSTKNSKFVNQYLSLGMQILGKSTLPEFGLCSVTESSASGNTCNPWNTAYSPGGSSGGAGALVAAGVVPIAHGNDGGGSLRTPASCCGLVALKSSRGRVLGIEGKLPLNITCQGVLTRSVRDTTNFYYGAERYYANGNLPEIGLVTHAGHKRLKIAVFTDNAKNEKADGACAEATLDAARLCEKLGHYVDFINCPYPQEIFDDFELYFGSLAFAISKFSRFTVLGKWDSSKLEKYTIGLEGIFKRNFLKYPFALSRLRKYQYTYKKIFDNCDVLVSPTNGTTPPKIGFMGPNQPFDVAVDRLKRHTAFTVYSKYFGGASHIITAGNEQKQSSCWNSVCLGIWTRKSVT